MSAVAMVHATDPKSDIFLSLGDHLDQVTPLGADVLLAVYIRPEQTKGGILLPANQGMRKEDNYQGKVGLVLKLGPLAFRSDATHDFGEVVPRVGDWVAINVGDTWAFQLGDQRCRVAQDVDIKLILSAPDIVL